MDKIFNKAIEALKALPAQDRERISWEILQRLEDKNEWDRIVSTDQAQNWLAKSSKEAIREYDKMAKRMSSSPISICSDASLREDSYWNRFDDLPEDVRKLAEANFKLWQDNPTHPSLRFKQIHRELPIFSFRVGMRHRTVGVRTNDNRLAWFWIGSFQNFQDIIANS